MIRFMIGEVKEVLEDHTITFNISDWAENIGSPPPSATPLTKLTRYPQEGDEVFLIQPDSSFEIFFYTITPDDLFDISLNYGPAYIRIFKDENDKYQIEMNDSQKSVFTIKENRATLNINDKTHMTLDSSGNGVVNIKSGSSRIAMTNTDVTINGHLKVTV